MENINEASSNVSISTGKSDEVNNDSMAYFIKIPNITRNRNETFRLLSWLNISHLEMISFANDKVCLSFSNLNYFDKISNN